MSESIRNMFNEISPRYDTLNRVLSFRRDVAWRRRAVRMLPGRPQDILDLCGGTGDFLLTARQAGREHRGVVADFSAGMLSHLASKGVQEAVQADALHLPFRDASFDACLCGFGMRNLDDLAAGIQSVARVLRPGGMFITLEFFQPEMIIPKIFYNLLAPLSIPAVGVLFGSRREAYEYLVRTIRHFVRVGDYANLLRDNDFREVKVIPLDGGISHLVIAVRNADLTA